MHKILPILGILAAILLVTPTLARDEGQGGGGNKSVVTPSAPTVQHQQGSGNVGPTGPAIQMNKAPVVHENKTPVIRENKAPVVHQNVITQPTISRDRVHERVFVRNHHFHHGRVFFHGSFIEVGVGPCWKWTPLGWIWICDPYDYFE